MQSECLIWRKKEEQHPKVNILIARQLRACKTYVEVYLENYLLSWEVLFLGEWRQKVTEVNVCAFFFFTQFTVWTSHIEWFIHIFVGFHHSETEEITYSTFFFVSYHDPLIFDAIFMHEEPNKFFEHLCLLYVAFVASVSSMYWKVKSSSIWIVTQRYSI